MILSSTQRARLYFEPRWRGVVGARHFEGLSFPTFPFVTGYSVRDPGG